MMKNKIKSNPCPEFPYFGAKYPDARCIEGYLHDLDNCDEEGNLYTMTESHPCPFCNTDEFIEIQKRNEVPKKDVIKWIKTMKEKYS
jgi:hypothetical protein